MSKFDAVVIGSGTGGLSAALSLATAGKKILLLEQHIMPGGCATSFVRGRFEFDASLHEFCSLGYPGNWAMTGKLLMEKYKLDIDWCLVPELYRCIGTTRSGKHFDLRSSRFTRPANALIRTTRVSKRRSTTSSTCWTTGRPSSRRKTC